ncbi:MAG TPA: crosslink repair DNA glycosylase YcaQ family protein, partial [Actinomycetes bacterium]|nr:crosslink repair DNA glycosylase YcaQ family protein [Actinomycetes bacterium]
AQARRTAIAAQGLAAPRPAAPGMRDLTRVVDRIGVLQIDSVNVLTRAQTLPLFSRLGPYDVGLLDRATSRPPRRLVEYWAHVASLVPPRTHRLLRWRMGRWQEEAWGSMQRIVAENPALVDAVLEEIRANGPMTSLEVEAALEHDRPRTREEWGWNWSMVKMSLEYLFFCGLVSSAGRTPQFERRYDLTDRVLPRPVRELPDPPEDEAFRELTRIAARAHGVATEPDLRDYFRLKPPDSKQAVAELVDSGDLVPVEVDGWGRTAYLHRDARVPRTVAARALLAPFDPLVWRRERVERLFGFRYRIEIYTKPEDRVFGYYVLPFLLDDTLVARVDVKADRPGGALLVQAAWAEPGAPQRLPEELAAELRLLAEWLGLDDVVVTGRGDDLAGRLAALTSGQPRTR